MNNSISNNVKRYGQSSLGRIYCICEELKKANGNVSRVPECIQMRYVKEDDVSSEAPKVSKARVLFTHENIEKSLLNRSQPLQRLNEIELTNARNSFQYAEKTVRDYYNSNEGKINCYDDFCLRIFLGSIYSHLGEDASLISDNFNKALAYLKDVSKQTDERFGHIDKTEMMEVLQMRLSKHKAIPSCNELVAEESPFSFEDVLLSKLYYDDDSGDFPLSLYSDIWNVFASARSTVFSEMVMKVNALDALFHPRFKIILKGCSWTLGGTYNQRNCIVIHSNKIDLQFQKSIFHEMTHKAIDRVFNNSCCPYFKDDLDAKKSYRESMRLVLVNLIPFAYPMDKIAELPFEQLVENYFTKEIVRLRFLRLSTREPYLWYLYRSLKAVLGGSYSIAALDFEFITNSTDGLLGVEGDSNYIKIIQPLLDYINKYVIPEMRDYVVKHPCKDKIK